MNSTKIGRRTFNLMALGALVSGAAHAAGRPTPARPAQPKTFVLVHGAWYGGWCWDRVAARLRAQGHAVTAPTCPGLGELEHLLSKDISLSTFITSITNHILFDDLKDVTLVGSGFAGVVVSGVADRIPHLLKNLVFVDAMILPDGQSVFEGQPPNVTSKRRQQVETLGKGIAIPPPEPVAYADLDAGTRKWVTERLRPQPVGTYEEKLVLKNPVGNGVPRIYVDCVASPFEPLVEVKKALRREPGWTWVELPTHHDPMITEPAMLASFLAGV